MSEWIEPEDEAQRLRFIEGIRASNDNLTERIEELTVEIAILKGEQRRNGERIRDLEEWTW